jgi:hypothetical protein
MNRIALKLEWNALRFELRRLLRWKFNKYETSDHEWCPPVHVSVLHALAMGVVILFLSTMLYWDTVDYVPLLVAGAVLLAAKTWRSRHPMLKEKPAEFMAACGYSRRTWYRASLLSGFWLSLVFGAIMGGVYIWIGLEAENMPADRVFYLKAVCTPIATGLIFLIHLSWEKNRRFRKRDVKPRKRRPKNTGDVHLILLVYVLILSCLLFDRSDTFGPRLGAYDWFRIIFMHLMILFLAGMAIGKIPRDSHTSVYPGFLGLCLMFLFMTVYRPGYFEFEGITQSLARLSIAPAGMSATIACVLLFLAAAWSLRPGGRDIPDCESE